MGCFESKADSRPDPTAVRGCTDVLWLVIFIIFWIFMVRTLMSVINNRTTPFSHLIKRDIPRVYGQLFQCHHEGTANWVSSEVFGWFISEGQKKKTKSLMWIFIWRQTWENSFYDRIGDSCSILSCVFVAIYVELWWKSLKVLLVHIIYDLSEARF